MRPRLHPTDRPSHAANLGFMLIGGVFLILGILALVLLVYGITRVFDFQGAPTTTIGRPHAQVATEDTAILAAQNAVRENFHEASGIQFDRAVEVTLTDDSQSAEVAGRVRASMAMGSQNSRIYLVNLQWVHGRWHWDWMSIGDQTFAARGNLEGD